MTIDLNKLNHLLNNEKKDISTENYKMSLGELANLYNSKEIIIRPEFQRFFRWTREQKTKLIESFLLGIPVPSIFIAERPDGVWEVIDGLQRLSTVFEFMGILKNEKADKCPALSLEEGEFLPLQGLTWDELPINIKLSFKRSSLQLVIIKSQSDEQMKFKMFNRLNTGGTPLTDQEVRNCLLLMKNEDTFQWIHKLGTQKNFLDIIDLSDSNLQQQYNLELVLRILIYTDLEDYTIKESLTDFLTNQMLTRIASWKKETQEQKEKVFNLIFKHLKENNLYGCFRKYRVETKKYAGGFSVAAYEVVATGLFEYYKKHKAFPKNCAKKIKDLWETSTFKKYSGAGVSGKQRFTFLVPFAKTYFEAK